VSAFCHPRTEHDSQYIAEDKRGHRQYERRAEPFAEHIKDRSAFPVRYTEIALHDIGEPCQILREQRAIESVYLAKDSRFLFADHRKAFSVERGKRVSEADRHQNKADRRHQNDRHGKFTDTACYHAYPSEHLVTSFFRKFVFL
jgi:hypothetical protein